MTVDTLIIGAGITGLSTAAFLGKDADYLILEADAEIGGYCKTIRQDGFVWDYSGHFFHFRDPSLEAWLRARMPNERVSTIQKKSFIQYQNQWVDFPFQKNIHQLPHTEFIECLHDLYFSQKKEAAPARTFKEMLKQRYGTALCEKFLFPYNEKLYATDLQNLDVDAMGRFFPHVSFDDVVRNMKSPDNASYNQTFTYPEGGAMSYVRALASEVKSESIRTSAPVTAIDAQKKTVTAGGTEYRFNRLVCSMPFPQLLKLLGDSASSSGLSWNQVLVFNLGFDKKGPSDVHWIYYPDRSIPFYRVGFYDNIFNSDRMSLYVELGFSKGEKPRADDHLPRVLDGLRQVGLVKDHRLLSSHNVVMNPAYVHITQDSQRQYQAFNASYNPQGIFSMGRYGSWTYCSIEDNMIQAREWVKSHAAH